VRDSRGHTALLLASLWGMRRMLATSTLRALLEHGAVPNAAAHGEETPLFAAVEA
jgi:ankyrin repeat protein